LSPLETIMWRIHADPRLRNTIVSVELLDRVPEWDRFYAAHEWGSRVVRRSRERVIEPALGVGAPLWSVDPDFDLDRHVRRIELPAPGTQRQLLDAVHDVAATAFDPAHPPWEAVLFEGVEGDRAAYVLKMHHAATDGIGSMQLLGQMHSRSRRHTPKKPYPEPPEPGTTGALGLTARRLIGAPFEAARRVPGAARVSARALLSPAAAGSDVAQYAGSLLRMLAPDSAEPSPLLAARSQARRYEAFDVPFSELKAAAKRGGGSVNDAFVAAVAGGLGRYHRRFGLDPDQLPIGIPISLRQAGNPMGGNQFAGVRLAAPVGEPDPARRMQEIRAFVLSARSERALDAMGALAPVLATLPTPVLVDLSVRLGQGLDVQASNLPGIAHPVYLAGARITHMFPFAPAPGIAAMIVMISHDGRCCVGVNLDPAAITQPDAFRECLVEAFDEVLAMTAT
jgi:WS/DGAT/MGAT family acyltransferase